MKSAPALFLLLLVALECVVCLPPDFFRNGRTKTETPDKRTSAQFQLIYKACRFCSFFSTDLGTNCRKNTGSREMCMRAYGFYVQNTIEQKSQSKW